MVNVFCGPGFHLLCVGARDQAHQSRACRRIRVSSTTMNQGCGLWPLRVRLIHLLIRTTVVKSTNSHRAVLVLPCFRIPREQPRFQLKVSDSAEGLPCPTGIGTLFVCRDALSLTGHPHHSLPVFRTLTRSAW